LLGFDFYPLKVGQTRVYRVEEINYNLFGNHDTLRYQLRETIDSSFVDQTGEEKFVLFRFKLEDGSTEWQLDSIWSTYRNNTQAVLTKNGNPVIALVFPAGEGIEWDANSLISRSEDIYTIQNFGEKYLLQGLEYSETLIVVQEDKQDSLISFDYRIEVFAKNVGLISKIDSRLKFCNVPECFGQKIVEEGRQYNQKMIEYEE